MTRVLEAEVAFPAQCELAEGPVWDAARGLLRWVDILPGHVHALDPVTGAHTWWEAGDPVGTFGLTRGGGLVLAVVDGFALAGPDGQDLRRLGEFTVDRAVVRLAVWGTGELRRYTPDGAPDTVVRLPVSQVTSAAFGGTDLSTLYITTARENFTPADRQAQPQAGDIFACIPGVTGRLPYLFGA